ncbi:MAG: RagB/SusD family nutrient uptake outer membrane protein [Cytophagales bacterium]
MKSLKNKILVTSIILLLSGCYDPFDLTRNDIISDDVVFDNPNLADAFLFDLYDRAQFHIKSGNGNLNMGLISSYGGESRNYGVSWQIPYTQVVDIDYNENGLQGKVLDYYDYALIRECNQMITKLPQSKSLTQYFIDSRVAEARFIRAHAYFEMVKRFGGIPLITDVVPIQGNYDEIYRERNSEKEIYDFISSEMDTISEVLPAFAIEEGRITKWTALALKSRALLYAGSVANFGSEQLNGLLGFPSSEASKYYLESLNASREIIQSGIFSLYRKFNDPVENFSNLFIDEADNPEIIFSEKYDYESGKSHQWDALAQPAGFGFNWSSNYPVYLETLEQFDFIDGTSGKVDRDMYDDNTPIDPSWYFEMRDPRMRASIFYPGSNFKGGTVFFHRSMRGSLEGWPQSGLSKLTGSMATGLLIRKRTNPDTPDATRSSTDYIVFRYGEILLNYVEASYYLNDPNGDMESIMNEIRDRAGMPLLAKSEITENKIRQERKCELAFEDHVFWDLRRWRIAVEELNNVRRHRLHYRFNANNETYTMEMADGDLGGVRLHPERNYYYALGISRLADNPKLIENPGY